ncbi:MAG: DUF4350 domain-containing protein [Clostridia bacterium]|nr:DUF4350 domain-containing protein [Clostridia bacterium]
MKIRALAIKAAIYGSVIIVLLTIGLFVYGGKLESQEVDYTTYSTKESGVKALYLLTEQMDYDAERFEKPSRLLPDDAVMVAISPDTTIFNNKFERKYLKQWLEEGNYMILIEDVSDITKYRLSEFSDQTPEVSDEYKGITFNVGKGGIIILDGYEDYTNTGIGSNIPGITFIGVLDNIGVKRVLFNEYYHGIGNGSLSFWDILGISGELVIIQLVIALAVFMFVKSRRFGKPVTVFEIIKRKENENLYALSNIYIKAKANTLVLETYLDHFKKEIGKFLGFSSIPEDEEIIAAANGNKFLENMALKDVLHTCRSYIRSGSKNTKQLAAIISKLEEIRKGIK